MTARHRRNRNRVLVFCSRQQLAFMGYHHEEEGVAAGVDKQAGDEASFCKIMSKTHVEYSIGMAIPNEFARKYKKNIRGGVLLQHRPGSRAWPLGVVHKSGFYHLTRGWRRFVIGNEVTKGDILVFRLIKGNCFSFEIYGADDGLEKIPPDAPVEGFNLKHSKSDEEGTDLDSDEPPALRKDSSMETAMTFQGLVKHSIHWLYITVAYKNCLPNSNGLILLIDSNMKEWPVNWFARTRRMVGGWSAFAHHHKIDIGDSIQFERQSKKSFKVTKIIRGATESEPEASSKSLSSLDI